MSTSLEYIALRAPAFASNPSITDLITEAENSLSATAYGSFYYRAVALLVCHWLALQARDENSYGVSGQITSEKTGKLSRSYSGGFFAGTTQSTIDPYYAQTVWGTELANMNKSVIPNFYI